MPYRGYKAARPLAAVPGRPSRTQIMRIVPKGYKRILSRGADSLYPAGLALLEEIQAMRAHGRANLLELARLLGARLAAEDGTTFHSRKARCAAAGVSVSTWKAHRARLEALDCLYVLREGRIYWHGDQTRHDAAVYVLMLPKGILRKLAAATRRARRDRETRPPTVWGSVGTSEPTREACGKPRAKGPPSGRAQPRGRPRCAELAAPGGAAGAVVQLFRQWGGSKLTDGWIGYLVRDFVDRGWTARDLAQALDYPPPPATRHRYLLSSVRDPRRVIAWRLGHWRDPATGKPLPSPSQAAAVQRNRIRQAAAPYLDRTSETARAERGGFDPGPLVRQLRQQLEQIRRTRRTPRPKEPP